MHTVFACCALLWLYIDWFSHIHQAYFTGTVAIYLTIAPVPAKQPWWIWINTSCEFIMNDCITTTKQSTTKPCAYFLGYTVNQQESDFGTLPFIFNFVVHTEHRALLCQEDDVRKSFEQPRLGIENQCDINTGNKYVYNTLQGSDMGCTI